MLKIFSVKYFTVKQTEPYTIIPWVFQILSVGRCPTGHMLLIRQTATGFLYATQYTVSGTVHNRTHNLRLFSLCLKQSHDKVVRFVSFTVTTLLSSSLSLNLCQLPKPPTTLVHISQVDSRRCQSQFLLRGCPIISFSSTSESSPLMVSPTTQCL